MLRVLTGFLGLSRSMVGLLSMVVLVGMGERMSERFLPLYILAIGGGPIAVGVLNGLQNLLNALYSYPGGYLAERIGIKRSLLFFGLMSILGYSIAIAASSWVAVIAGAGLFLSWSAISLPATMALVAEALPRQKRTMGVTMHSLVRRLPMAMGPILGGALIATWGERNGIRVAFLLAIVMVVLGIGLQQRLISAGGSPLSKPSTTLRGLWKELAPPLKSLLVSDVLIRFCEQIPYAFVVIWCMKEIASPVSAVQFGTLTAIEMTTATLVYVPVAAFADRGEKKPFVLLTFAFFTSFPLVLYFSRSFTSLIVAFVVRGLKEFGEPARKALILDLAPEHKKAAAFGLYYLIRDVIVSVAAFGGAFLWQQSPALNMFAAFGCGITGTVWFALNGQSIVVAETAQER